MTAPRIGCVRPLRRAITSASLRGGLWTGLRNFTGFLAELRRHLLTISTQWDETLGRLTCFVEQS